MGIVGITDRSYEAYAGGISIVGKVWKGTKKPDRGIGKDLVDRFRVEIEDEYWRKKFLDAYGTLEPKQLRIYLPFPTPDRCFDAWYAAFTAQGFQHKCNGQRIVEKMVDVPYVGADGGDRFSREKKIVDEPCLKGDKPVCSACGEKGSGLLYFFIRELYGSGMGSTRGFRMAIHGANDIPLISQQLQRLHEKYGSLSGSLIPSPETFGYIPYIMSRTRTGTTKPIMEAKTVNGKKQYNHTGARSQSEYGAISISEDPEWLERLQRYYQEQQILRLKEHPELRQLYGYKDAIALPSAPAAPTAPTAPTSATANPISEIEDAQGAIEAELVEIPYLSKEEWTVIWNKAKAAGFTAQTAELCILDMGIESFRSIPRSREVEVSKSLSSVDRANFYKTKAQGVSSDQPRQ